MHILLRPIFDNRVEYCEKSLDAILYTLHKHYVRYIRTLERHACLSKVGASEFYCTIAIATDPRLKFRSEELIGIPLNTGEAISPIKLIVSVNIMFDYPDKK